MRNDFAAENTSPLNTALNATLTFAALYSLTLSGIFFLAGIKRLYDVQQAKKCANEELAARKLILAFYGYQSEPTTNDLFSRKINAVNAAVFNARCKALAISAAGLFFCA